MGQLRFVSGDVPLDRYGANSDLGVITLAQVGQVAPVQPTGAANGGVLDAAAGTLQVSDDGITWRSMLRGDTGAAVTALSATNIPVALNSRFIRCTAGAASIRPMITS